MRMVVQEISSNQFVDYNAHDSLVGAAIDADSNYAEDAVTQKKAWT